MAPGSTEQFELAGWGARFGAHLIDTLLRLLLAVGIAALGFALIANDPFSFDPDTWLDEAGNQITNDELTTIGSDDLGANNLIWMFATAIGLYFAIALIYAPLFMAMMRGATPGKRICGIRVVREDGRELGFGWAFVREPIIKGVLINGIAGAFFLPTVVNYLWPLWDRECRAGHDFLAKTRVVKARR